MGSESKGLSKALESRVYTSSDTKETKLKKDLLILTCGLMNIGVVGWLAIYWAMGIEFSTTVPLGYQVISVASLAIFLVTRNFDFFRIIQCLSVCLSVSARSTASLHPIWLKFGPRVYHGLSTRTRYALRNPTSPSSRSRPSSPSPTASRHLPLLGSG